MSNAIGRVCGNLVAFALAAAAAAMASTHPNIVVVLADDLGYGDLGCYNPQTKIATPFLDRLAAQGVRLTDAHSAASVCTPARYGLLTGQYPWRPRHPGRGSASIEVLAPNLPPWAAPLIAADRLTLPGLLRQHGYATAAIGKWHLGWIWPTRDGKPAASRLDHRSNVDFTQPILGGPTSRGFDYYFGTCVPNYPPYCFIENDRTVGLPDVPTSTEFEFPGPKVPGWSQEQILPELTRRAVRYVEAAKQSQKPFFLYFALTSPHHPILPTAEFRGRSGAGEYGDFVMQTDWTVGQLLAALERTGQAENTLFIFTSDNGPEITRPATATKKAVMEVGAYDRIRKYGHASMGPLRGTKYESWEGGHRVPFLARWPGRIPAGTLSGELLCLTDLMATCASIVGAQVPLSGAEDSFNALPVLLGAKGEREAMVVKSYGAPLAVRRGDWAWITARTNVAPEPDWFRAERGYPEDSTPGQLYNLKDDLGQRNNLFSGRPDRVSELRTLLERLRLDQRSSAGAGRSGWKTMSVTAENSAMASPTAPSAPRFNGPWDLAELKKASHPSWGAKRGLVQEVHYPGESYRGKPTRVFAYVGRPANVDRGKWPGILLIHGGGGRAFPDWATMWAERGYVALAMDTAGCGPDGAPLADGGPGQKHTDKFQAFTSANARDQWAYHAVAAVIRGLSVLENMPEVDARRIGITGISWGGFLTCIVAGLDDRVKCAVPVYGGGFLWEDSGWLGELERIGPAAAKLWSDLFDPARYLHGVRAPILFVNRPTDAGYRLGSHQKSYRAVPSAVDLVMNTRLGHSHSQGWSPPEIQLFMDSHLLGTPPLARVGEVSVQSNTASARFSASVGILRGELCFTTDAGAYEKRKWQSAAAEVAGGAVQANLPSVRPLTFYFNVIDERGAISSSPHVEMTQ